jgi:hypothetical protein
MAWSPSQNLLAWTDNEGVLTRWQGCIPPDGIDPVQASSSAFKSLPAAKKHAVAGLFDEAEAKEVVADPDADMHEDTTLDAVDFDNDDWILDDLGGAMDDDDEKDKAKKFDGIGIREMGKAFISLIESYLIETVLTYDSECDQGSAPIPIWQYPNGEQKTISRCAEPLIASHYIY